MNKIRLPGGQWLVDLDSPLGSPGGFGAVFLGSDPRGVEVAVKRLKLGAYDAAHRELRMANELLKGDFQHVLNVLDAGLGAETDRYYVIMPLAGKNLQDDIDASVARDAQGAAAILLQVASGLAEVPAIVHRDLKPANVLFHEDTWKIADFGIARFVEESTSVNTLKGFLSPPYASPEQLELKHATAASDIYSLGCIGYALLTGSPPFPGPTPEDFREQHLNQLPPELEDCDPRLVSLLSTMLRKPPGSRPSLIRVIKRLELVASIEASSGLQGGSADLAHAVAHVEERNATAEAAEESARVAQRSRATLAKAAYETLHDLSGALLEAIRREAPDARWLLEFNRGSTPQKYVQVGDARLYMIDNSPLVVPADSFPYSGWDVVAKARIAVAQSKPLYIWSSSLWNADLEQNGSYRWYEISYFRSRLTRTALQCEPCHLDDYSGADMASGNIMAAHEVAWGPHPVDDEDSSAFVDRWLRILAKACVGKLKRPSAFPLE